MCRVLLGIGESVYLPGGMKVVSLHFRDEESAWPAGVFDLGAKLGLAIGTAVVSITVKALRHDAAIRGAEGGGAALTVEI